MAGHAAAGTEAILIDSRPAAMKMEDFYLRENRFKMLTKTSPEHAKDLWGRSQEDTDSRWALYNYMASRPVVPAPAAAPAVAPAVAPAATPTK